jgi:hypothetical protein
VCDRLGLFARELRLATLPILATHAPITTFSGAGPRQLNLNADLPTTTLQIKGDVNLGLSFEMSAEQKLRIALGALVHRKLAAITPDLKVYLPFLYCTLKPDSVHAL